MDERQMQTLLSELADTEAPPARVDIALAVSRGRRGRRLRHAGAGGTTLAIAAAAGAIVTLVAVPGQRTPVSPGAGGSAGPAGMTVPASPGPSGSAAVSSTPVASPSPASGPATAPIQFDPLVPYAWFGWLPAGYTVGGGAGAQLTTGTRSDVLSAGYGSTGSTTIGLTVTVKGACTTSGSPSLPVLNCSYGSGISGPIRAASRAPDVNGRPAFWAADVAKGGYLFWEYAPNAWSTLTVPSTSPASKQAVLFRVAANVRYGDSTPVSFPFWMTGVPAGWTVTNTSFSVSPSGALLGQSLGLGPAVDPGGLGIDVMPAPPGNSCKFIPGQSQYVTLDGTKAVLRLLNEPGKGYQSLCATSVTGLQVYISLDTTKPASNTPLPGVSGLGGALGVAKALHLLGANPSAWTTSPLR
jgi:hypothetical protein